MAVRELGFRFTGDVDSLDNATGTAERRIDRVRGSSDRLSQQSGQLTSSMGALTSGLELVGLESGAAATAIESAGLASDFASGVADTFNTVMDSSIIKTIKRTTVTKATTVATKAQTVAQRALNLAMRANPIGVVITLLAALAAGIAFAWRNSETFRNIVRGAMSAVQEAFGWVIDRGEDVVGWFRDLPGNISDFVSGLADTIKSPFISAFEGIKEFWNSTLGGKGFTAPDWVPGIGGKGFHIPRLQAGGIAAEGMPHLVGEGGPELFIPNRTGLVVPNDRLAGAGIGGPSVIHNHIEVGGEVVRTVDTRIDQHNRRTRRQADKGAGQV